MRLVHLTASTFFGGPERQMLGLAAALPPDQQTFFLSFAESGRCAAFLDRARADGFAAEALAHDTPNLPAAARDLVAKLREVRADVLLCHGYKADLIGRFAARRVSIPAVAVSRGWTSENRKVRAYEAIDRWHLRLMDRVVCVSEGQAAKVRRTGVPPRKIAVIRNAARPASFRDPTPEGRRVLQSFVRTPGERIVLAAGRLSPEKGVQVLIAAAREVLTADPGVRFVVLGDGSMRPELERLVREAGLDGVFALPGFRDDLDALMPCADLFVLPSFTEGLPNVVLEASAAAVPVVATAVGGTPEVLRDGVGGYLVLPGDPAALARRICDVLANGRELGTNGRAFVQANFSFEAQAHAYQQLFAELGAYQPEALARVA